MFSLPDGNFFLGFPRHTFRAWDAKARVNFARQGWFGAGPKRWYLQHPKMTRPFERWITLPKTTVTFWTQKWRWMKDDFPVQQWWFWGSMLIFRGVKVHKKWEQKWSTVMWFMLSIWWNLWMSSILGHKKTSKRRPNSNQNSLGSRFLHTLEWWTANLYAQCMYKYICKHPINSIVLCSTG